MCTCFVLLLRLRLGLFRDSDFSSFLGVCSSMAVFSSLSLGSGSLAIPMSVSSLGVSCAPVLFYSLGLGLGCLAIPIPISFSCIDLGSATAVLCKCCVFLHALFSESDFFRLFRRVLCKCCVLLFLRRALWRFRCLSLR